MWLLDNRFHDLLTVLHDLFTFLHSTLYKGTFLELSNVVDGIDLNLIELHQGILSLIYRTGLIVENKTDTGDSVKPLRRNRIEDLESFLEICRLVIFSISRVLHALGYIEGDKFLVIERNGAPYAIVSSDELDSYTSMPSRIMRAINYDLKGDYVFVLIPYILLLLVTLKSRLEFRKTYPILIVVTNVFGLIFAWFFYITAFWFYVLVPVFYGVVFSVVWVIRILIRAKKA